MLKQLLGLFKAFCDARGCPEWFTNEIAFYLVFAGFVVFVTERAWNLIKGIILWRNQRILNKDLHPYYSKSDVYRATRYYVPTKFQNVAPSEDEEPGRKYIASAKNKLIPLFLKKAFNNDQDDNKYYLVLADSGMGKTTFMINLYIAYKNQLKSPFSTPNHEIRLFPLGYPNILEDIEKVENKENTILLLDAFDEDIAAVKDYKKRMNEILTKVHKFREVVITCRTQFFPSKKEEPHETGYFTGGERGEYHFQKLYLSVFDNKDIKRYLKKRFSIFQWGKYKRAQEIAEKSPTLLVRPMLLSHIEELVKSRKTFEFSFQIYEELIQRWIQREASKPGIRQKYESKENFERLLSEFSRKLAMNLYENRKERNGYFIPKGEEFEEGVLKLSEIDKENQQLSPFEGKTKSLLNRNASGDYKFSHKSVFEYFLAVEMMQNGNFYTSFDFHGMDATKNFLRENIASNLDLINVTYSSAGLPFNSVSTRKKVFKSKFNDLESFFNYFNSLRISPSLSFPVVLFKEFSNLNKLILSLSVELGDLHAIYLVKKTDLQIEKLNSELNAQLDRLVFVKKHGPTEVFPRPEIEDDELSKSEEKQIEDNIADLNYEIGILKSLYENRGFRLIKSLLTNRKFFKRNNLSYMEKKYENITIEDIEELKISPSFKNVYILIEGDIEERMIMTNQLIKEINNFQKEVPDCLIYF